MSKKFLTPIKLAQGASNPAVGSAGELFFNTTDVKVYAHNGTSWVPSGGGVTVSATAPATPIAGDAWYDTVDGTLYVYYNDGDSSQWVEVAANSGISVALEGRVGVVETYVTTLQSEMGAAQSDINALETRATALELADSTTNRSGLVPIIPSSVAVGAGSASVASDGEITFTNSRIISANLCFSSLFRNYLITLNITSASAASGLIVQFRTGTTTDVGTTYRYTYSEDVDTTAGGASGGDNQNLIRFGRMEGSGAIGELVIYSPFDSGVGTRAIGQTFDFAYYGKGAGVYKTAKSHDGFTLHNNASITITGSMKIYGYR